VLRILRTVLFLLLLSIVVSDGRIYNNNNSNTTTTTVASTETEGVNYLWAVNVKRQASLLKEVLGCRWGFDDRA